MSKSSFAKIPITRDSRDYMMLAKNFTTGFTAYVAPVPTEARNDMSTELDNAYI
jgi:hypothetical protein